MSRNIGARIKEAREAAGLTQAQLAKEVGVHYTTPSQWENGHIKPRQRSLRRIAAVTGRPYMWFVKEDGHDQLPGSR